MGNFRHHSFCSNGIYLLLQKTHSIVPPTSSGCRGRGFRKWRHGSAGKHRSFAILKSYKNVIVDIERCPDSNNLVCGRVERFEYKMPPPDKYELPRKNIKIIDDAGAGHFGKVYKCRAKRLPGSTEKYTTVAAKTLKDGYGDKELKTFVMELHVLKTLKQHTNVLKFLGCCSQAGDLLLITEFVSQGDLLNYVKSHQLEQHLIPVYMKQVVHGMQFLHVNGLVHRDLAARNVLVDGEEGNLTMKISDFGSTRAFDQGRSYIWTTATVLNFRWMAPETERTKIFSAASDLWSFGVLLWEVMSMGKVPFSDITDRPELLEILEKHFFMEKPENCPDRIYDIMVGCWQLDPASRLKSERVLTMLQEIMDEENADAP
ncbi:tyrosine kinase receptor Cad96Ca-like [Planococcus citri]|uniref:tyrosine kinase receptor Cad96Ca-like n=1 Tax=Planococcus citri TaxID=170843 RepID=UPI0031F931B5